MTSPFPVKTHETMDLARALMEEDSSTCTESSRKTMHQNDESNKIDVSMFRGGLVVTKESSTELIPSTQEVDSSPNGIKPGLLMRDLNAGKGMVDDDGRPAVGKVFSRVIQISSSEKPKPLKRRGQAKKEEICSEASCSSSREKSNKDKDRPQSSVTQSIQQRTSGPATISNICPSCNRTFSDETMRHHMVFCTGSSKEIM